jgi:hypothetical protein
MMNCEARGILQDYVDGILEPARRRALEIHVQTCPICQRELLLLRLIDDALRKEPALTPAPDFTQNVMARLPITLRERVLASVTFLWSDIGIISLTLLFIGFWVLKPHIDIDKCVIGITRMTESLMNLTRILLQLPDVVMSGLNTVFNLRAGALWFLVLIGFLIFGAIWTLVDNLTGTSR